MTEIENNQQYFEQTFHQQSDSSSVFIGIEFENCEFIDCDFTEAKFQNCKFNDCTFNRCNLSLVKLTHSHFYQINFLECKLLGIDWTYADWSRFNLEPEISFKKCILNDSSFFELSMHSLIFEECKLNDVDFREGDFSNSTMIYCDFHHSLFMRTNLQCVDFTESINFQIDIFENKLTQAKFSRYEAINLLESLEIELVD
ncbi:pentapeptide repeat-containing protein [Parashewanella spongiae]|uniref:Pentapeptide repeat-containing protein n=1 Tax=Parashewanella spongiae TaxID=342950 RepID=A0A3A6U1T7_9GAMM|nr:pentapeptide repeat-containing protein [Parashewanella spongiae]MCL1079871.1 pentapeptide repeat-containing protein [Parashewanella spongiae]RJY06653.1 pentapeptide repeat-containing protein [Parashewanella spongiae]